MNVACLSNWLAVEEPKFTRKQRGASIVSERDDGAWYVISVAAIKAEVHEQTLRHYERLGLISPARKGNSPHSPRLYSDRDIERVMHIRGLMRDLGVNLAGVEAILHMKDRMEQMQLELEQEMALPRPAGSKTLSSASNAAPHRRGMLASNLFISTTYILCISINNNWFVGALAKGIHRPYKAS